MPEKIFIPPLLKVIIAMVGSLFALVLGDHIQDGKIDTRNWVFWSTFWFGMRHKKQADTAICATATHR